MTATPKNWIQSGVWTGNGSDLLLSDVASGSIIRISPSAGIIQEIKISLLSDGTSLRPTSMQVQGNSYLMESGEGHLFWVTNDFHLKDDIPLGTIDGDDGYVASSAWSWIESGDRIFVFGDRGKVGMDNSWSVSLMRFSTHNPSSFDTLASWSLSDASRQFSRLGYPVLASVHNKAYILLIGESARIHVADHTLLPLKAFPSGYSHVPEIPARWDREMMSAIYAKMVNSQTVAGLYSEGEFLYVLTRRPDLSSGGTVWNISKIDPNRDLLLYTKKLPIESPHIVLVPGASKWAIVEKGPVKEPGKQSVFGIVLFSPDETEAREGSERPPSLYGR
jgi:hypothetical protein